MRKYLLLILALAACLGLTGCCVSHQWQEATCVSPKTCAKCGKAEGESLGHDWVDADCEQPKTCIRCQAVEGESLGHDWMEATCEQDGICLRCNAAGEPAVGHQIEHWTIDEENMQGECLACGAAVTESLDWDVYSRHAVTGFWRGKEFLSVPLGKESAIQLLAWMDCRSDGTVTYCLNGIETEGRITFASTVEEALLLNLMNGDQVVSQFMLWNRESRGEEELYMPMATTGGTTILALTRNPDEAMDPFLGKWIENENERHPEAELKDLSLEFLDDGQAVIRAESSLASLQVNMRYLYYEEIDTAAAAADPDSLGVYGIVLPVEEASSCHVIAVYDEDWKYQFKVTVYQDHNGVLGMNLISDTWTEGNPMNLIKAD